MSSSRQQPLRVAPIIVASSLLLGSAAASAGPSEAVKTAAPYTDPDNDTGTRSGGLFTDIKDYYTAPLHWDLKDWAYFGGAIGLVAAAHHYDSQVRTHFIKRGTQPIGGKTNDLQDFLPAAAAVGGTWLYSNLIGSSQGHHEAWNMVEAGGLSVTTSFLLKYASGRERPNQTDDPNRWRKGGSSFPSIHATAAFAVGAVLAESGNDDYRIVRRFLGYGVVAGYTAFQRLKHNAHWLSDDVAGAAIGGATAHFILERDAERHAARENGSALSITPLPGGAMLSYNLVY
ncbi:MAG TPA: phosphatase PAP2 family protein [Steroidobacteraceae bacterium]